MRQKQEYFEQQFDEQQQMISHTSTQHRNFNEQQDPLIRLIQSFDQIYKDKAWMVHVGQVNTKIDQKVIGQIYVINGMAQTGKTSLVYWALRNDNKTAIATVDCSLYRTQLQFIQKLTKEIGQSIRIQGLDKRTIASQNINFAELNKFIKQHKIPIVIIIRHAQRLVEYRKQILLYNLCQWFATDIKEYIGIVFITRLLSFTDRLQKRVVSRLQANKLTLFRHSPQKILEILIRRIQCLISNQRQRQMKKKRSISLEAFEKVHQAINENREILDIIRKNQQVAQKDIVFYLNAFKIVFSDFDSVQQIIDMHPKELRRVIAQKFVQSFQGIFPLMPKNLLKTCNMPQFIIVAIIYHMGAHKRTPYRYKTVYQIYLQFKSELITSQGSGSSFNYSKNLLQKAIFNLEELSLLEIENKDESIWNCEINCSLHPEDIKKGMEDIPGLPYFIKSILGLI